MIRIGLFLLIVFFSLDIHPAYAQSNEELNRRATKWNTEARDQFAYGNFDQALNLFNRILDKYPNHLPSQYFSARCQFHSGQFDRAIESFLELSKRDELDIKYADAWFYLGKAYFYENQFQEAERAFEIFLEKDQSPYLVNKAKSWLQKIDFIGQMMNDTITFEPEMVELPLEDHQSVYLPMKSLDGSSLFYTLREGGREYLVYSDKDQGGWSPPNYLSFLENYSQTAASSLSPDGKLMLLTICNHPKGYGSCDLYLAYRRDGKWNGPINLGVNINGSSWESQPSFGPDGRTFYFASDRDGGYGGRDIWRSRIMNDGSVAPPQNVGSKVNSPGNEGSPFIHQDGQTLYFKSKGHPGMGDYDLFVSRKKSDGSWSTPQNLGYPINTPSHDGAIFVDSDGKTAFMASDRFLPPEDRGKYRIFKFELPDHLASTPVTYIMAEVVDQQNGRALPAEVQIVELKSNELLYSRTLGETGSMFAVLRANGKYALNADLEGYEFVSMRFETDEETSASNPYLVHIEMAPIDDSIEDRGIVLENVLFEFGSHQLDSTSFPELNRLARYLKDNRELRIQIHGHTDNVGDPTHNQKLSQQRAESVVSYLTQQGVDPDRIVAFGFGENRPVSSNETEQGRSENRRTEMVIVRKN